MLLRINVINSEEELSHFLICKSVSPCVRYDFAGQLRFSMRGMKKSDVAPVVILCIQKPHLSRNLIYSGPTMDVG